MASISTKAAHTFAVSLYSQISNVVQLKTAKRRWRHLLSTDVQYCIVCGRPDYPARFWGSLFSGSAAISKTFEEEPKAKAHFPVLALARYFPIAQWSLSNFETDSNGNVRKFRTVNQKSDL